MKPRKPPLLTFLAAGLVTPLVVPPVTVIEVTSPAAQSVQVDGWTGASKTGSRAGFEGRATPFRIAVWGGDIQAAFTVRGERAKLHVRATRRRAWVPLVAVAGDGTDVSLAGHSHHLELTARTNAALRP